MSIKEAKKQSDVAYKFLSNFCTDYCKDEEERENFFTNLSQYLEAEIELEGRSNQ